METNMVTEGLSELRRDSKGLPRIRDITRVPPKDKISYSDKRLKFQKVRRNTD